MRGIYIHPFPAPLSPSPETPSPLTPPFSLEQRSTSEYKVFCDAGGNDPTGEPGPHHTWERFIATRAPLIAAPQDHVHLGEDRGRALVLPRRAEHDDLDDEEDEEQDDGDEAASSLTETD